MSKQLTRRSLVKTVAGAAGVAAVGRYGVGTASAQRTADIYLGGWTGGWEGREPSSIADTTNPTLTLAEGETYVIAWENADGAPHNVVIENDAGDTLVESTIMSDTGRIQLVEFTATSEMTTYYCKVHPGSMEGSVEVVSSDSSEAIPAGGDVTLPAEPTPTATPTPSPTPSPTATDTETPTAADTDTETPPPDDSGGDETDGDTAGSGPGFGVGAAAAGFAALAELARRRSG